MAHTSQQKTDSRSTLEVVIVRGAERGRTGQKSTALLTLGLRYDTGKVNSRNAAYQGISFAVLGNRNSEHADSRTAVNTDVECHFKAVSLALYTRNIFDRDYITATFQYLDGYTGVNSARD